MRNMVLLLLLLVGAEAAALTPQLVNIDPLGAEGEVAWIVHSTTLNVRNQPTTSGSTVLGTLSSGSTVVGDYYLILESDEEWLSIDFSGQPAWISRTGITRVHPTNAGNLATHTDLPIGSEIVNRWWGIPISYEPTDLVVLPRTHTTGTGFMLRADAAAAVVAMIDAARAEGLDMYVGSPYRSGTRQQQIYNNAVANDGLAQRYSAPPGHSEHQLGTTVDLSRPSGGFLGNNDPQHAWLEENGARFGFRQTYLADNVDETGYIEEPWHWRYIGVINTLGSPEWWVLY